MSAEKILPELVFKPEANGWEAQTLPLCYAAPLERLTYSHDLSQRSKVREVVLDVLEVDLSSAERATALLPAGVLAADLLGEVLRFADLIFAEKIICSLKFLSSECNAVWKSSFVMALKILTKSPVPRCKEHRRHREQPSSAWIPWSGQWEDRFLSWHGSWWWQCPGRWRLQGWIHWWTGMGGSHSQL